MKNEGLKMKDLKVAGLFTIMLFIFLGCVKKNSCQCKADGVKYYPPDPTNSYFEARKECEKYQHETVYFDSLGGYRGGTVKCRIKLL